MLPHLGYASDDGLPQVYVFPVQREESPPAPMTPPSQKISSDLGQPQMRVKDIARVDGVRSNQLVGLGLVVGLAGTGDSSGASLQMVANMLERFGLTIAESELRSRNAAAVTVTAELPPFARPGDTIDVTVSSLGSARSLAGGFLLQTPLQAGDGQVYAVAQGAVSIGGFEASAGGSSAARNHATVGRIPSGAIVEGRVISEIGADGRITWLLHQPDFTTASRVATAINAELGDNLAQAIDGSAVEVVIPSRYQESLVDFITLMEELPVATDSMARVVINERTGTVVIGHRVRLATVAVSHGGLTVRVGTEDVVSQPPPFSDGETVVTRQTRLQVEEEPGQLAVLPTGASVEDLVNALNAVGASPRDVIAILQAIKEAGALYGELETI